MNDQRLSLIPGRKFWVLQYSSTKTQTIGNWKEQEASKGRKDFLTTTKAHHDFEN